MVYIILLLYCDVIFPLVTNSNNIFSKLHKSLLNFNKFTRLPFFIISQNKKILSQSNKQFLNWKYFQGL